MIVDVNKCSLHLSLDLSHSGFGHPIKVVPFSRPPSKLSLCSPLPTIPFTLMMMVSPRVFTRCWRTNRPIIITLRNRPWYVVQVNCSIDFGVWIPVHRVFLSWSSTYTTKLQRKIVVALSGCCKVQVKCSSRRSCLASLRNILLTPLYANMYSAISRNTYFTNYRGQFWGVGQIEVWSVYSIGGWSGCLQYIKTRSVHHLGWPQQSYHSCLNDEQTSP